MKLLEVDDLSATQIRAIWALAAAPPQHRSGTVAWSFEGNGVRTRTSFIQAFRELAGC
jgi:ornithine carbamoyltransferase